MVKPIHDNEVVKLLKQSASIMNVKNKQINGYNRILLFVYIMEGVETCGDVRNCVSGKGSSSENIFCIQVGVLFCVKPKIFARFYYIEIFFSSQKLKIVL